MFLLGAALGATVEAWMNREWAERWIMRGHRSVLAATLAGAVLPGCAMSTMPLAESLRRRGAAVGTLTAFIMIAPILSPHTVLLTATLVSVPMAIGRVVLSVIVSVILGALLNSWSSQPTGGSTSAEGPGDCCSSSATNCCGSEESAKSASGCCGDGCGGEIQAKGRLLLRQFWASLRSLTPYLIGGLLIAAVLTVTIPQEVLQHYLRGGWTAYLFAVLVGIPVYVCDGGEIPLTRALLQMGVGIGPAFCFMLSSVGTCLPTIAMASKIIGWRSTVIYLAAWLILAIGGGLTMSALSSH